MSAVLRAEDEPVRTRFDYWHHVMSGFLGPVDMRAPENPDFRDWIHVRELGPVHVADMYVDQPGQGDRSKRHVRRSEDLGLCKIGTMTGGSSVVEQHGRQAVIGPGDFVLVDLAQPLRLVAGPTRLTEIVFPRSLLPLQADDVTRATAVRVPGDRGPGALVSSLARQLPAQLDDPDGSHASRLGTAVLDLFAVAIAAHLDRDRAVPPDTRQRALLARIHAFIEEHLPDPELSPATVAAAHFVSLRYLHKLFETQETTVADLVRRRRLERCRQDLLDPAQRTVPVSAIAVRWGFTDPAHFSRLFRSTHGMPPTRYRRLATGRPLHADPRSGPVARA